MEITRDLMDENERLCGQLHAPETQVIIVQLEVGPQTYKIRRLENWLASSGPPKPYHWDKLESVLH